MQMIPTPDLSRRNGYPETDRRVRPGGDRHRNIRHSVLDALRDHFSTQPDVYVSGGLLVFYEKGNKRKRLWPDVFIVRAVEKLLRRNYLVWEEGVAPQVVIELTWKGRHKDDLGRKMELYRDVLKVREYFLFDAEDGVLDPRLQGFRLGRGQYERIQPAAGRLPSQLLGLHLEADGADLRLWDPRTQAWLPTTGEQLEQIRAQIATPTWNANRGR